jgi:hypothetical protein
MDYGSSIDFKFRTCNLFEFSNCFEACRSGIASASRTKERCLRSRQVVCKHFRENIAILRRKTYAITIGFVLGM